MIAAMINPEALDADIDLERQIDFQAGLITTALTRDEKVAAEDELRRLHSMRSPERVEQMEREAGIR
jgi:hypothetical protein